MAADQRDTELPPNRGYRSREPEWLRRALGATEPARGAPGPNHTAARSGGARRHVAIVVAAALVGVLAGALTWRTVGSEDGAVAPPPAPAPPRFSSEPVSVVAGIVARSVVQLETDEGLGSGVVYDRKGLILTAAHVVEGHREVTVRLADGRKLDGRVIGIHRATDVAVVSASRRGLPVAALAVGRPARVGQLVVAIGSPFGLQGTVTSGVVSALDRSIPIAGRRRTGMIQTDASINPGNSGGALADRNGRVIGINDAIRTRAGDSSGVGFAIPIDVAAAVAEALSDGRTPRIGWLGVGGTEPLSGRRGALVTRVRARSPAHRAGLRRGDLITAVNGRRLADMSELAGRIRLTAPGTIVRLEVIRNGRVFEIKARVGVQ
jgi:putative serine protease PepD